MATSPECERFIAWALNDLRYKAPETRDKHAAEYMRQAFALGVASTRVHRPTPTDAIGNPVPESRL